MTEDNRIAGAQPWADGDALPGRAPRDGSVGADGMDGTLPPASRSHRKQKSAGEVSTLRWIIETVVLLVIALLIAQGIKTFVIQPYVVPSGSMIPAIQINDRVLANKFVYLGSAGPAVGDVVVLDDPTGQFPMLIKRVIALGGQTVDFIDGKLLVDGHERIEPYVMGKPTLPQMQDMPYVVPEGHVWVMGDNRTDSADSRTFGSVPESSVRGRAFWTYWPADRFGPLQ